jgi:hypothetical protein
VFLRKLSWDMCGTAPRDVFPRKSGVRMAFLPGKVNRPRRGARAPAVLMRVKSSISGGRLLRSGLFRCVDIVEQVVRIKGLEVSIYPLAHWATKFPPCARSQSREIITRSVHTRDCAFAPQRVRRKNNSLLSSVSSGIDSIQHGCEQTYRYFIAQR